VKRRYSRAADERPLFDSLVALDLANGFEISWVMSTLSIKLPRHDSLVRNLNCGVPLNCPRSVRSDGQTPARLDFRAASDGLPSSAQRDLPPSAAAAEVLRPAERGARCRAIDTSYRYSLQYSRGARPVDRTQSRGRTPSVVDGRRPKSVRIRELHRRETSTPGRSCSSAKADSFRAAVFPSRMCSPLHYCQKTMGRRRNISDSYRENVADVQG